MYILRERGFRDRGREEGNMEREGGSESVKERYRAGESDGKQ